MPSLLPSRFFFSEMKVGASDVEAHLRANGIDGEMSVRLLTDEAGKSKGTAFVDLHDAEQMHKSLALHHSTLCGRRINVEKSCGGRNSEKRDERLQQQRLEQAQKVQEKVDAVLADFSRRGVVEVSTLGDWLQARLFSYTPAHVAQVLEELEAVPVEQRGAGELERLMNARDEGGKKRDFKRRRREQGAVVAAGAEAAAAEEG